MERAGDLPQFDLVFARIAKKVPNCQFVFIQFQEVARISELFKERGNSTFGDSVASSSDRDNAKSDYARAAQCRAFARDGNHRNDHAHY
jgi:hypothetical protein